MQHLEVIETQNYELEAVSPETYPVAVLIDRDIPAGMPRTNRLDKMTTDQARWATLGNTKRGRLACVSESKQRGGVSIDRGLGC